MAVIRVAYVLVAGEHDVRRVAGIRGQGELALILAPVFVVLDEVELDLPVVAPRQQRQVDVRHRRQEVVAPPVLGGRIGRGADGDVDLLDLDRDLDLLYDLNRPYDLPYHLLATAGCGACQVLTASG